MLDMLAGLGVRRQGLSRLVGLLVMRPRDAD